MNFRFPEARKSRDCARPGIPYHYHMNPNGDRLTVPKTYKLFIGGKFPRTESGRYLQATAAQGGKLLANYAHASRKDLRNALVAARAAQSGWAATSACLKGQILYRAAEMMESRRAAIAAELAESTGANPETAAAEVEASIDRLVHLAGWTDKYQQVFGSVNPVASSHFNFSTPEPTGVVGIFCPDRPPLLAMVSMAASAILSGNSTVILASEKFPLPALSLAEVLATSDLPGGVINLLTGKRAELATWLADHMDVNAIVDGSRDPEIRTLLHAGSATNLKRVSFRDLTPRAWFGKAGADPYAILDTIELKTAWHPIGV